MPQHNFRPAGNPPVIMYAEAPVVHYGYLDYAGRQRKVAWYRSVDPPGTESNRFEGNYAHCLGEPDQHAPGPVQLAPWEDV